MKSPTQISRRQFLARGVALFGVALGTSAVVAAPRRAKSTSQVVYRLTSRKWRGAPKSVKKNCANLRFASPREAEKHRLGAWDRSRIVPLNVSKDEYFRLFFRATPRGGHTFSPVADLRKIK